MVQVIPGAEAWSAAGSGPHGDVGLLVLHGLTGNPVSMRPLAEALAERGFAVELPRLPGHGTRWQDLQRTTWRDWTREAVAALEQLRSRTRAQVAVGLSGGGTVALHLAATRGHELSGVAVVNPSLFATDRRLVFLPVLRYLRPSVPGIGNDIAKAGADEKAYPRMPLRALASFVQFQRLVRDSLPAVTVPLLVLTSSQDHVVEPENSALVVESVASDDVQQCWLERSYHVATLDHDLPEIVERTAAFAGRVTA